MGGKLSTLWNLMFAKRQVRVVTIGLDAAGKTTMTQKLKLGETLSTIPTIGFNVDTIEYKNLSMTIWDVGGQHRLRSLWQHYYRNTDCIIFIVDASDTTRIAEAAQELHHALAHDDLRGASLLVFANKQDLPTAMPLSEIQERLKLRDVRDRKWFIQGCSATQGTGLWEGLDWLSKNIPPPKAETA